MVYVEGWWDMVPIFSLMTHERRMPMILGQRSSASRKVLGGRRSPEVVVIIFTGLLVAGLRAWKYFWRWDMRECGSQGGDRRWEVMRALNSES